MKNEGDSTSVKALPVAVRSHAAAVFSQKRREHPERLRWDAAAPALARTRSCRGCVRAAQHGMRMASEGGHGAKPSGQPARSVLLQVPPDDENALFRCGARDRCGWCGRELLYAGNT